MKETSKGEFKLSYPKDQAEAQGQSLPQVDLKQRVEGKSSAHGQTLTERYLKERMKSHFFYRAKLYHTAELYDNISLNSNP